MFDSTNANDIPATANKLAGYVNGKYTSYYGMVKRFPQYKVFGIDVLGGAWHVASILDYEVGNPVFRNPTLVRSFIENRNRLFPGTACLYSDFADLPEVEEYAKGLWHVNFVANWGGESLTGRRTGRGNLIVATQLQNNKRANWDVSDTLETWT
jgi:hypothetical protein